MTTYADLAADAAIERTMKALKERTNVESTVVDDRAQALEKLIASIREGDEVVMGTSTTLEEIGFQEYLAQNPDKYQNLQSVIRSESDEQKRAELRRRSASAHYYIGSVHAVAETGELVIASRTGSQLGGYVFTARNVIWVIGAQKIVPTLEEAVRRVREYVFPLEDERMKQAGFAGGSRIGKLVLFENEARDGRASAIFVKEHLGF